MCETASSSLPRAVISRSALAAAASAAVLAGGRVADLRRDAWGHGVLAVAQAVTAAGAERVLVDAPGEVEALHLEGMVGVTAGEPDIDSRLLYGLPDAAGSLATRPVMRLTGRVLSTKRLRPGDAVSYGYTFRATGDTTVALITGGYAQGIVRALGNNADVEVDGVARPIVGRVAMDVCVVDLEGADAEPGTEVTYFGGEGPATAGVARWADVTGMTSAELVAVAGAHAARGVGSMTRPELRLSGGVFRANIAAVRARVSPSTLMLVLKDDAYGHGLVWAVETAAAAGVDCFGSYDIRSGIAVRRIAGGDVRIFAWATSTDAEIDDALLQGIELGVGTIEYLRRIIARAAALGARARVHLKIDTGLHRNGVLPEDWPSAVAEARQAERSGLVELVGVWSHIGEASDADDDDAQAVFLDAVRIAGESGETPGALHLTASAASWWRPELRGTVSRIGAFCYGIRSADGPELDGVRPAATLVATVAEVSGAGASIGIGSFDGLPSTLSGASVGTPGGTRRIRSVGPVSTIVEGWPGARVGDEVVLFGAGERGESSATTLAEGIDTVGEEILTRLTARVRRVVVD